MQLRDFPAGVNGYDTLLDYAVHLQQQGKYSPTDILDRKFVKHPEMKLFVLAASAMQKEFQELHGLQMQDSRQKTRKALTSQVLIKKKQLAKRAKKDPDNK